MATTSTLPTATERAAGRGYLWAGLFIAVLAIALYMGQYFVLRQLWVPWYAPALLTLGAFLLLLSVVRRRSIVRVIALVLVAALAGFQWHLLVNLAQLPAYTGPAKTGQPVPAFQTALADGRSFSDADLKDGTRSVMVFFRGRW